MRQHTAADGRNCWKSARERERRKARFEIRERVSVGGDYCSTSFIISKEHGPVQIHNGGEKRDNEDELLAKLAEQINQGDRSAFSLSLLSKNLRRLSTAVSTEFLVTQLPEQQMLSWFGLERFQILKDYIKSQSALSLMEYSVLLGRYHILGAFILGGINPCLRGPSRKTTSPDLRMEEEMQKVGHQILQIFFDRFPLTLSGYIVKRAVDMRLKSFEMQRKQQDPQFISCPPTTFVCGVCEEKFPDSYRLVFSEPEGSSDDSCHHIFCELCFWKDIVQHVGSRWGDVVLCPCCTSTSQPIDPKAASSHQEKSANDNTKMTPQQRSQESKDKYITLPVDSQALKALKQKKKKPSESQALAKSWTLAVLPSMGNCQSVRRDKFFSNTEACAVAYVKGCLDAGVDVNILNEYGQTPLYIAAWKDCLKMVELLLYFGADPRIRANGGLTAEEVCRAYGHVDTLKRIQDYRTKHWNATTDNVDDVSTEYDHGYGELLEDRLLGSPTESALHLETLISPNVDHPGAGSYLISGCIPHVDSLLRLWESLPIDQSSAKTQKKLGKCSDRSYFCDSEGWLRNVLKKRILEAFRYQHGSSGDAAVDQLTTTKVTVLPHMRFLHYSQAGSSLAPHVDLNRVDPFSGLRSTHSFLLYLADCRNGGETILTTTIEEANSKVLAKVKPQSGRLLLFPHACPHEGATVEDVPKLLIRGEVYLDIVSKA